MGAKITDAIPSGTGAISSGTNICLGINKTINVNIGSGSVSMLSDYTFAASGSYNFSEFGYTGNGTWSINMDSTDNGDTYTIGFNFKGTLNGNPINIDQSFPANASETGDPTDCDATITYSGSHTFVQTCQGDTIFQKAKIWLDTSIDNQDWNLYIYSSDEYGSC